jgi:hypothetical protein
MKLDLKKERKQMRVLEYTGKEEKTFDIKSEISISPERKFKCKPGDTFMFDEQVKEKTALFLAKMYHSYFRIVKRMVTEKEICENKIKMLIDQFGYNVFYDALNSEIKYDGSDVQAFDKKRSKGRPKKDKKDEKSV